MQDARDDAQQARDEAKRRLAEIPDYDADAAVEQMLAARHDAGWVVKTPKIGPDGKAQEDEEGKTIWEPVNLALDREAERIYNRRKGRSTQDQTAGEAARADREVGGVTSGTWGAGEGLAPNPRATGNEYN